MQEPQLLGNISVYVLLCKPIHGDTEETTEDEMEAAIATVIDEDLGTLLIEAGIESALLVTLHTVGIVGNALVHRATHLIVVEIRTLVMLSSCSDLASLLGRLG